MHIHPFAAHYPHPKRIDDPDEFFNNVKAEFPAFKKKDLIKSLKKPGIYIYRISKSDHQHTGIVATVDIQDYLDDTIIKHENILEPKADDTSNLMLKREALLKPVLLTYPGGQELREWCNTYVDNKKKKYSYTPDEDRGWVHAIWEVKKGKDIDFIKKYFEDQVPAVYIADGHHRTAVMADYYEGKRKGPDQLDFSRLLAAFFPFDELEIHDYNRIVEVFNQISPAMLIARLSNYARIDALPKARKPVMKGELTMMVDEEWFSIRWRKKIMRKHSHELWLDVELFNKYILEKIFGMRDVRSDMRIKYIAGVSGVQMVHEKTAKSDIRLAFCLYPVHMSEFKAVSDAGRILPPKSTWFEPRLKNGFIIQSLKK